MAPETPRYVLYGSITPNAVKPAIMLKLLGVPYEYKALKFGPGGTREPEYRALCATGKVPFLMDREAGVNLFESAAIVLYLATVHGKYLPSDPAGHAKALKWLAFFSTGMGPVSDVFSAKIFRGPDYDASKEVEALGKFLSFIESVFGSLGDGYLAGPEPSIADVAAFPMLYSFKKMNFDGCSFDGYPGLLSYLERVAKIPAVLDAVAEVMPPAAIAAFFASAR